MDSLFESLFCFKGCCEETELYNEFRKLAPSFLYGGYINVRDEFKIFIRTVEFYFHSESTDGIHDPIVYHRNGKDLDIVPYFPLMTLHAHNSGFDITFESPTCQYRASALIRAYEIKDNDGNYLKWVPEKKRFEKRKEYEYNTQSTFLYAILNGFPLGRDNSIMWIDSQRQSTLPIQTHIRQGVYKSESEYYYKPLIPKIKCDREWSFTRVDKV